MQSYKEFLIKTNRLIIRNLKKSDIQAYFNIFSNPNIALYDDFQPISIDEAVHNIDEITANYLESLKEQEFAVALDSTDETIGVLYLKEEENRTLVGYHFNENFQGKGYAFEAVKDFIRSISENTTKPIEALVDYKNLPSIRLLEKLGFENISDNSDELVYRLHKKVINELLPLKECTGVK